jgi:DNA-directed RNA polymerase specialized sigma subunit
MNAKQYLEQAIVLQNSIKSLQEEIETYRTLAEGAGAIRYDRDGSQTQRSQNAPFETPLIIAADLEREAKKEIRELWESLREIRLVIGQVEDAEVQQVLRYKYLTNQTNEAIGSALNISTSTVKRRLEDGYHEVSLITGYPEPPKQRMPARERTKRIFREVYGDEAN